MTTQTYKGANFSVEPKGIHSLRYTEGGRSAIVDGERLAGTAGFDYVLYSDTAGWEDEDYPTAPSQEDHKRIIDGVCEALKKWGVRFEVK